MAVVEIRDSESLYTHDCLRVLSARVLRRESELGAENIGPTKFFKSEAEQRLHVVRRIKLPVKPWSKTAERWRNKTEAFAAA